MRALFEERDEVFSRFRPDSELSRVNAASAAKLVSPLFARMVETALLRVTPPAAWSTRPSAPPGGAGYDRDFAELAPRDEPVEPARAGWRSRSTAECSSAGAGWT